jgi:hypothetical protein
VISKGKGGYREAGTRRQRGTGTSMGKPEAKEMKGK